MFDSKFHCLAEIEALRAGFKPSGVSSAFDLPRLVRLVAAPRTMVGSVPVVESEAAIRLEMERRLSEHFATRAR